jgi:hypothetical protein
MLLAIWGIATILVASLTREAPHATRSFFLIAPGIVLSAIGAIAIFEFVHRLKNKKLKGALFVLGGFLVAYNLVYYFTSYYVRFPILYAPSWRYADKEVSNYIAQNEKKYDKILIDDKAGFIYSSYVFYAHYPPHDFQRTVKRLPDTKEGFSFVSSFGKFEIREIDWIKDYEKPNILILTTPQRKPNEIPPLKAFYNPKRPVAVVIDGEILQYPIEEIPYVLIETKR